MQRNSFRAQIGTRDEPGGSHKEGFRHVERHHYNATALKIASACHFELLAALPEPAIRQLSGALAKKRVLGYPIKKRIVQLVEPENDGQTLSSADRQYLGFATPMMVVDRKVALISITATNFDRFAVLLRNESLIAEVVQEFTRLWDISEPRREPVKSDRQRAILTRLAQGQTDSAIAAALDVGERTIRREVNALMSETGSRSRFQLGIHTAGWNLRRRQSEAPDG